MCPKEDLKHIPDGAFPEFKGQGLGSGFPPLHDGDDSNAK